jgi:hypothetical protein
MEVVKRRWGILAISVVMFLITMVSMEMTKQKTSLYLLFWIYIGYLAFKGKLKDIFYWVKWAAIINGIGLIAVLIFIDSNSSIFSLVGANSKTGWMIGIGIPLLVMLSMLLYIHKISNKFAEENSIESLLKIESTDRLNQVITNKKNQKIAFLLVCALLVLATIFYIVKAIEEQSNQPKVNLKLVGVSLGDTKDHVLYLFGEPENISVGSIDKFGKEEFINSKNYKSLPNWITPSKKWDYDLMSSNSIFKSFEFDSDSGKVNAIRCATPFKPQPWELYQALSKDNCSIKEVTLGDSEAKVVLNLGAPASETFDSGTKHVFYPNLNAEIILQKKLVVAIELANRKN